MSYFSLHNHTEYSNIRNIDSINKVTDLIDYALKLNLSGLAITDHESLSGHIKAHKYITKLRASAKGTELEGKLNSFKLLLGNEIYLTRNNLTKENYIKDEDKYYHFILIAKDKIGHEQLRVLSTRAWLRTYRQFIERVPTYYSDIEEIVGKNPGHLIATSACLGGYLGTNYQKYITDNDPNVLRKMLNFIKWCRKIFKNDFYLELQPSLQPEQITFNKFLLETGKEFQIKCTVATDSHYLCEKDRTIHKAYLNSANKREVDSFYKYTYLMDQNEVANYMRQQDIDATPLFENTLEIGGKCEEYSLEQKIRVPFVEIPEYTNTYELPDKEKYPYSYILATSADKQDQYLSYLIEKGLREKIVPENWEEHRTRNELEITELVELSKKIESSMSGYHVTVAKICELIWNEGDSLMGISRGSGFGFNINYLINITQASPLGHGVEFVHWRYINRDRVSMADLDLDTQAAKKTQILKALKDYFGELNVVQIATFGTEKSKSALLTACRGLDVDIDLGQYYSSMIPSERGFLRSLHDCYYGNEENPPVKLFVEEMKKNPQVWEVAQKIEGLVCRRGTHACGMLINSDKTVPITDYNALMRAPKGSITTQFDLDDTEFQGGLKFDLLSTDALDRIRTTIDLLIEDGLVEKKATLKETYESVVGTKNLIYENPEMWKMLHDGKVYSCFQMDTPVGKQGVKLAKPENALELSSINSIMRLMPQGKELPLLTYVKFKNHPELWIEEMKEAGLNEKEILLMKRHLDKFHGIADTQESAMMLAMDKEVANFTVSEADKLRKIIAKKKLKDIEAMQNFFFEKGKAVNASDNLLRYIWDVQIGRQLGYAFNLHHSFTYGLIALQEINLAYSFPLIYWYTACLIVDSGSTNSDEESDLENEEEPIEIVETDSGDDDDEDDDGEDEEDTVEKKKSAEKKKKPNKTVNYGKISVAIGKITSETETAVALPDINLSSFSFKPDLKNNVIRFGLKGITRIGDDLVAEIIKNRPYDSVETFLKKVKVNKLQMINLIKAGTFDGIGDRTELMDRYIDTIADLKSKLTLQNVQMLIGANLLPDELQLEKQTFAFNKYIKKLKDGDEFVFDDKAYGFYSKFFDIDQLEYTGNNFSINSAVWKKQYDAKMANIKTFITKNQKELLVALNTKLRKDKCEKYCDGNISQWEMQSVGYYFHEHELKNIAEEKYHIENFFELPEEAKVDRIINIKGKEIPLYKLTRILGTIIDKDKLKSTVTLSTTHGVVIVKVYKAQFTKYDKQISIKLPTGKKKVVEKSWFTRGNKMMITGIRRQDNFVPKTYKSGKLGQYCFSLITSIEGDEIKYTQIRQEEE